MALTKQQRKDWERGAPYSSAFTQAIFRQLQQAQEELEDTKESQRQRMMGLDCHYGEGFVAPRQRCGMGDSRRGNCLRHYNEAVLARGEGLYLLGEAWVHQRDAAIERRDEWRDRLAASNARESTRNGELRRAIERVEAAEALAEKRNDALNASAPYLLGTGVPNAVLRQVGLARRIAPAEAQKEGD